MFGIVNSLIKIKQIYLQTNAASPRNQLRNYFDSWKSAIFWTSVMSALWLHPLLLVYILYFLFCCAYTQHSPGDVDPYEVHIGFGKSANITCRINLKSSNSSTLYFLNEATKERVPQTDVAILNETTIVYMIRNATEQNQVYSCKSGTDRIGYTKVIVGGEPAAVEDFSCINVDYTYMLCTFTKPPNTTPTRHSLRYYTQNQDYIYQAKLNIEEHRVSCNLTLDDGQYKPHHDIYKFTLTSTNTIGLVREQSITINQHDIVQPIISEFNVRNITTNSCVLTWQMQRYSYYKLKRLQMEVQLNSPHFNTVKIFNCRKCNHESDFILPLHDLPYAYYNYSVNLRLKMKTKANIWSPTYTRVFRTQPRAAEHPPATDTGSFYINNTHIRLYWQPLPVYHENGSNFRYIVTKVLQDGVAVKDLFVAQKPLEVDRYSALYQWQAEHSYEFIIRSSNDAGVSVQSSRIVVPAMPKNYTDRSPLWIRNVYHASNSTYTFSWLAPADKENLKNYTVFWCHSRNANSNECKNIIGFTHLSKDDLQYIMPAAAFESSSLILAVSANYEHYYTGMHWSMCTADATGDVLKLEPKISELTAHAIKLDWSLERVCISLVEGYELHYCRVEISNENECIVGTNASVKIEKNVRQFWLSQLKPFSRYKMEMYMYSGIKKGPISDSLFNRTLEAAPLPPRNLTLKTVASDSALISWLPPTETYGYVRFYTIVVFLERSHENYTLDCNNIHNSILGNACNISSNHKERYASYVNQAINFTLKNLGSFTNYSVYVVAHTVADSAPSNLINIKTLIGVPSSPQHVITAYVKDNIKVQWQAPHVPSGRVEFYEVLTTSWFNDERQMQYVSLVIGSQSCTMQKPSCSNTSYKYTVEVRAVNIAARDSEYDPNVTSITNTHSTLPYSSVQDDELSCQSITMPAQFALLAEYSNSSRYVQYRSTAVMALNYICSTPTKLSSLACIPYVIVGIMLMAALLVLFLRKIKKMASIECKIPAGLMPSLVSEMGDGINDIIEKDEEGAECYKELVFNNENHRLLYNESTHLGDLVRSWSLDKSSGYVGSDRSLDCSPEDFAETHNKQMPFAPTVTDDVYTVMKEPQANVTNENAYCAITNLHPDSGYVRPNTMLTVTPATLAKPATSDWQIIQSANGYIKPNKSQMFNWQPEVNTVPIGMRLSANIDGSTMPKGTVPLYCDDHTTLNLQNKLQSTTSPGYMFMKENTRTPTTIANLNE